MPTKRAWLKEESLIRLDKHGWKRAIVLKEHHSYALFLDTGTYSTKKQAKEAATKFVNKLDAH